MSKALPKVIAVVGPTASGKTKFALLLAKHFRGEIIVADSRQIYRGMDIGTNKSRGVWRTRRGVRSYAVNDIPYHGIDLAEPNETFTVQQWKRFAERAIRDIWKRGKIPILEGGTGLYLSALLDNLTIPRVPPHRKFRESLERRIAAEGLAPLVRELLERDPESAAFLDFHNPRRVVRALEVIEFGGMRLSAQRGKGPKRYEDLRIGITISREDLDRRIRTRAQKQLRAGLEGEVRGLTKKYGWDVPAMSGIGYAEWKPYFAGLERRENVLAKNIARNKRLARNQRKWFRKDPRIRWITSPKSAEHLAAAFLSSREASGSRARKTRGLR